MKKILKTILCVLLALILGIGAISAGITNEVHAANQIPSGSEGIVAYHHTDKKWVDYNFDQGDPYPDLHAPDLGVYPQDVYCINPTTNPSDSKNFNMHFRWRWNLSANGWLFDNSQNHSTMKKYDYKPYSGQLDDLAKIIYYGESNYYSYNDIQNAVFWFVTTGNGSAPDNASENWANEIVTAYKNGEAVAPASYNLYMYIGDSDATQIVQHTVGLAVWQDADDVPQTTSVPPSATVTFLGRKTIDGVPYLEEGSLDKYAFRMYLPAGTDSWNSTVDGNDGNGGYHTRVLPDQIDANGDIVFGEIRFSNPGDYIFRFRELRPGDNIARHDYNSEKDVVRGIQYDETEFTITLSVVNIDNVLRVLRDGEDVTSAVIEVGTWDNTTVPDISNTTAKINDQTGSVELTEGEEGTMTDVVEFINLEEGKKYRILSFIYKDGEQFADSGMIDVTSEDSPLTVTFDKKITEAGTYTIKTELSVYKETVDGEDKYEPIAAHNAALNDEAETVTVTVKTPPEKPEEPENPTPEEPEEEKKLPLLSVKKTSNITEAHPGDVIPFVITVTNSGEGDAKEVVTIDTLGEGLTYVSDDSNGVVKGNQITWTVEVPAGKSVVINISARVNDDAVGKIVNNVKIVETPENPVKPNEEEDEFNFPLTPGKPVVDNEDTPPTGDETQIVLWSVVFVAALGGMFVELRRRRAR